MLKLIINYPNTQVSSKIREDLVKRAAEFNIELEDVSIVNISIPFFIYLHISIKSIYFHSYLFFIYHSFNNMCLKSIYRTTFYFSIDSYDIW